MPNRGGNKVIFVLSPDKVVRKIGSSRGECLACGAVGILSDRLGKLWEIGHQSLFKDELVHTHLCPMNRVLYYQAKRL